MSKVNIGKIVNTHGIKGEIKIKSDFDKKREAFKPGNKVIIENNDYTINTYRVHKGFDMITLKEFDNINQVLAFKTKFIYINREELGLSNVEYILDDLIDMDLVINNEVIGKVVDYSNNTNPLLKIKADKIFYIPIKGNYIDKVDLEKNIVYAKEETKGLIL